MPALKKRSLVLVTAGILVAGALSSPVASAASKPDPGGPRLRVTRSTVDGGGGVRAVGAAAVTADNPWLRWKSATEEWDGYSLSQIHCESGFTIQGVTGVFALPGGPNAPYRCEVMPKIANQYEGQTQLVQFSTYLPADMPINTDWQLLCQWHDRGGGVPPVSFGIEQWGSNMVVTGGWSHPTSPGYQVAVGPVPRGRWVTWHLLVNFSVDPTKGSISVARDGEVILNDYRPPTGTLHPYESIQPYNYFKIGYYRNSTMTQAATVLHRGMHIYRLAY